MENLKILRGLIIVGAGLVALVQVFRSDDRHVLVDATEDLRVELDGKQVLELRKNQSDSFTVSQGPHTVRVIGSQTEEFPIDAQNKGACFVIRPGPEPRPIALVYMKYGFDGPNPPAPAMLADEPLVEVMGRDMPCELDAEFPSSTKNEKQLRRLCHLNDDGYFACKN